MFQLRLFPLNTVLFPRMPLPLHIFEGRYRLMIDECMTDNEPFGIVLIRRGAEALGPLPEPHRVGCTAHIAQAEPLEDGRLNILVVGQERFRIRSLDDSKPYLSGTVEDYPLTDTDTMGISVRALSLIRLYERYLQLLASADLLDLTNMQLPDNPIDLAYSAAHTLQVPRSDKQELLEIETAPAFLQALVEHYRLEVPLLDRMLTQRPPEQPASFSLN